MISLIQAGETWAGEVRELAQIPQQGPGTRGKVGLRSRHPAPSPELLTVYHITVVPFLLGEYVPGSPMYA